MTKERKVLTQGEFNEAMESEGAAKLENGQRMRIPVNEEINQALSEIFSYWGESMHELAGRLIATFSIRLVGSPGESARVAPIIIVNPDARKMLPPNILISMYNMAIEGFEDLKNSVIEDIAGSKTIQ